MDELLKERIVVVSGEITDALAHRVIEELLALEQQDAKEDVYLFINSKGGLVTAGFAIYDAIQAVAFDVHTIGLEYTAGMGTFLLASGTHGKRHALVGCSISPNLHFNADVHPEVSDSLTTIQEKALEVMAHHTGASLVEAQGICGILHFIDAREARELRLVDRLIHLQPHSSTESPDSDWLKKLKNNIRYASQNNMFIERKRH